MVRWDLPGPFCFRTAKDAWILDTWVAMEKRPFRARGWSWSCLRAALCVPVACVAVSCAAGQAPSLPDLLAPEVAVQKHEKHKAKQEQRSGPQPSAQVSLQQLGFAAPASFYLGDRLVQASLSFLDENRLLFTFRVPGLVVRDRSAGDASGNPGTEERNIRALVLALPSGKIEAESLWHLHDFAAYLWPLPGGRFLLRDRSLVQIGNSDLALEPFLRFPGKVRFLELDPAHNMLATQNYERAPASERGEAEARNSIAGDVASSDTLASSGGSVLPGSVLPGSTPSGSGPSARKRERESATYLRILSMNDRKILATVRIGDGLVHLPIDGEGYYDAVRGMGTSWQITYRSLGGGDTPMLSVESACTPPLDVLAPGIVLVSACRDDGGRRLSALTRDKRRLWDAQVQPTHVWPLLAHSENGTRVARATLDVTHSINAGAPLDPEDIHSQTVQVFDVATGRVAITGPASPVLDGGGNFALSPSGNRFAVLNEGSIQVYDLPPAPPLPPLLPETR